MYKSLHLLTPTSLSILPSNPLPLGNHIAVLYVHDCFYFMTLSQAILLIPPKDAVFGKFWSLPGSQAFCLYKALSHQVCVSPKLPGACQVCHDTFLFYKSMLKHSRKQSITIALCPFAVPSVELWSGSINIVAVWLFSHAQLFGDSVDYGPPDSSVHAISQARMLEWVAISSAISTAHQWSNPGLLFGRWLLYHSSTSGKAVLGRIGMWCIWVTLTEPTTI